MRVTTNSLIPSHLSQRGDHDKADSPPGRLRLSDHGNRKSPEDGDIHGPSLRRSVDRDRDAHPAPHETAIEDRR